MFKTSTLLLFALLSIRCQIQSTNPSLLSLSKRYLLGVNPGLKKLKNLIRSRKSGSASQTPASPAEKPSSAVSSTLRPRPRSKSISELLSKIRSSKRKPAPEPVSPVERIKSDCKSGSFLECIRQRIFRNKSGRPPKLDPQTHFFVKTPRAVGADSGAKAEVVVPSVASLLPRLKTIQAGQKDFLQRVRAENTLPGEPIGAAGHADQQKRDNDLDSIALEFGKQQRLIRDLQRKIRDKPGTPQRRPLAELSDEGLHAELRKSDSMNGLQAKFGLSLTPRAREAPAPVKESPKPPVETKMERFPSDEVTESDSQVELAPATDADGDSTKENAGEDGRAAEVAQASKAPEQQELQKQPQDKLVEIRTEDKQVETVRSPESNDPLIIDSDSEARGDESDSQSPAEQSSSSDKSIASIQEEPKTESVLKVSQDSAQDTGSSGTPQTVDSVAVTDENTEKELQDDSPSAESGTDESKVLTTKQTGNTGQAAETQKPETPTEKPQTKLDNLTQKDSAEDAQTESKQADPESEAESQTVPAGENTLTAEDIKSSIEQERQQISSTSSLVDEFLKAKLPAQEPQPDSGSESESESQMQQLGKLLSKLKPEIGDLDQSIQADLPGVSERFSADSDASGDSSSLKQRMRDFRQKRRDGLDQDGGRDKSQDERSHQGRDGSSEGTQSESAGSGSPSPSDYPDSGAFGGFGDSDFGGGFGDGGFGGFDLDNFIEKPQNEMEKQLSPEENLDLTKKVPALEDFPTFDQFLKGKKLPDIPGLKLPKSVKEIKSSGEKEEDLTKRVKDFLKKQNGEEGEEAQGEPAENQAGEASTQADAVGESGTDAEVSPSTSSTEPLVSEPKTTEDQNQDPTNSTDQKSTDQSSTDRNSTDQNQSLETTTTETPTGQISTDQNSTGQSSTVKISTEPVSTVQISTTQLSTESENAAPQLQSPVETAEDSLGRSENAAPDTSKEVDVTSTSSLEAEPGSTETGQKRTFSADTQVRVFTDQIQPGGHQIDKPDGPQESEPVGDALPAETGLKGVIVQSVKTGNSETFGSR